MPPPLSSVLIKRRRTNLYRIIFVTLGSVAPYAIYNILRTPSRNREGVYFLFLAAIDMMSIYVYNIREMSGELSKFLIKQAAGAGLIRGLGKLIPRPVVNAGRWVKHNPIKSVLGAGALGAGGYAMLGRGDGEGSGMDLSGLLPALGGILGRGSGDQQQPVHLDRNPSNATLPKPPNAQPDYGTAAYDTADGLRHLYGMRRSLTPQFDPGAAMPYNPEAR